VKPTDLIASTSNCLIDFGAPFTTPGVTIQKRAAKHEGTLATFILKRFWFPEAAARLFVEDL
jgi:hypothetical protein